MSADWQPGDLALCVDDSPGVDCLGGLHTSGLRAGGVYTVAEVILYSAGKGLQFEEARNDEDLYFLPGFKAERFRKIRPHTPDEEDRETIRLLNGAPVREPVA